MPPQPPRKKRKTNEKKKKDDNDHTQCPDGLFMKETLQHALLLSMDHNAQISAESCGLSMGCV